MRCISPFDNGSYHMVTIRTSGTNRQLGEGFLGMQLLRNILSPPNEMHFSIRQRVVSTNAHLLRIDDSKATQQLFLRIVSIQVYWTTLGFHVLTRSMSLLKVDSVFLMAWLLFRGIPPTLHMSFRILFSLFTPIGWALNQVEPFCCP